MKRVLWSLLCLMLLAALAIPTLGPAFAAEPPVAGDDARRAWDRLRWGMNVPEASAALGRMVGTLENGGRFTHQIDGAYKGYRLAFTFAPAAGLERVVLMDAGGQGLADRFVLLEERLLLKYGAPFRDETQDGVRTLSWLTPTTLVQLLYRPEGTKKAPVLHVLYVWRQAAGTQLVGVQPEKTGRVKV